MTRIKSMAAALLVAATAIAGGESAGALGPAEAAAQAPPTGRNGRRVRADASAPACCTCPSSSSSRRSRRRRSRRSARS